MKSEPKHKRDTCLHWVPCLAGTSEMRRTLIYYALGGRTHRPVKKVVCNFIFSFFLF